MKPTDYAVHAEALMLRRDGSTLLDRVTLAVPSGAVVGLVGRNGAGKSSLLRCLAGLDEPDAGACTLLGCPSLALTDPVRERLGYVGQTPDLFEWMTALEHLQTVGRAYPRWDEARCLALAASLDLPLGLKIGNLSGGDQQKVAVVLALAHDPDLLLLDEPVASLDPLARREFMRAMFSQRAGGDAAPARSVIISSHILSDLERVVSHVAFMRGGRLQLFDTWDAMLEHLRLVAPTQAGVVLDAIVCGRRGESAMVVDTRRAPACAGKGRSLSLDELFLELNA